MSSSSTEQGGSVRPPPPPPVPRRHPSRPSLNSARSTSSSTSTPPPPAKEALLSDDLPDISSTTRRPTSSLGTAGLGFTGRVGLGSPRLEFFSRREEGGGKAGSYIDHHSGLPSPPGTESDVGPGKGLNLGYTIPEDDIASHTRPLSSSRTKLRPKNSSTTSSPRIPRSSSSSSSVYNQSLRDVSLPSSPAISDRSRTPSPIKRSSTSASQPISRVTPEKETAVRLLRRISGGNELDERIREAEEKIRRVNTRSSRPSTSSSIQEREGSPPKSVIKRSDSLSRQSPFPRHPDALSSRNTYTPQSSGGELRRSATLSSASARAQQSSAERMNTPEQGVSGTVRERDRASWEDTERDRSGGSSGSGKRKPLPSEFRSAGPFTPSPKNINNTNLPTGSSRSSRIHQLAGSPEDRSDLPSPSTHFSSPPSRFVRQEGMERNLPDSRPDVDNRGLPKPRDSRSTISRSASVMDRRPSTAFDSERSRYQSRSSTSSRLVLTPGDSVSVIDSRPGQYDSAKKDPLEVLRRIEESREMHNRQWEEDRAVSVLGEFDSSPRAARRYERPESGDGRNWAEARPRIRPATSMSSVRDAFDRDAPRTAPVHRLHCRTLEDAQMDSPSSSSLRRTTSRLSQGPSSEPRHMRSSTSLAGRAGSSVDSYSARTEHGRLLLEAFRALELKLPHDLLEAVPDLIKSLQSTISAQETINTSIRESLAVANHTNVAIDLGNPDIGSLRRDFDTLLPLLREAGRASDQSIRELTRVILDLPKLPREASKLNGGTPAGSRLSQGPSPSVRRSESIISRTSMDSARSPEIDNSRRWNNTSSGSPVSGYGAARERGSLHVMRPASSMASFVSRFRRSPGRDMIGLPPINQSPPKEEEAFASTSRRGGEYRHSDLGIRPNETVLDSPPSAGRNGDRYRPERSSQSEQRSPDRFRNILKKKASTTSNHTVRGTTTGLGFSPLSPAITTTSTTNNTNAGSSFFPSPIRRTTTAISQITVGDMSPPRRKSFRSDRSSSIGVEEHEAGSYDSRFSFRNGRESGSADEDSGEGEALKMLAAAAKRRESESSENRLENGSGTGKWKNGWKKTSK